LKPKYPRILSTPRDVYYFLDISPTDWKKSAAWQRDTIEARGDASSNNNGILLIWDPVYGVFNSDASRSIHAQEVLKAGWVPVYIFNRQPDEKPEDTAMNRFAEKIQSDYLHPWVVFLSPRDKDGNLTDRSLEIPLPREYIQERLPK
jgi:hypothetical protein